jgi:carboxypeptidase Taq
MRANRLWENVVGRSWEFWQYFCPRLQTLFPAQLDTVPLEAIVRAINQVRPSLIRVEADEVTYNLHIMLRFDLEQDLLAGRLAVRDLPKAYRARFAADMGFEPPDDRDGVLQDMHWLGYFFGAGYVGHTLGNILSAAIWEAALADQPEIPAEIAQGRYGTLHGWLVEHVYRHGRKFGAPELIERSTGGPLAIEPYIRYLGNNLGTLYRL